MPGFTTLAIARQVQQDVVLRILHSHLAIVDDEKASPPRHVDGGEEKRWGKEHHKRHFRVDVEDEDPAWREEGALARFAWFWLRWRW